MENSEPLVGPLQRLTPFIGTWSIESPGFPPIPPELADQARMTIGPTLRGAYLLERWAVPVANAPESLCLIRPNDDNGFTRHHFDSRGIARVYAMTFDGHRWTLERRGAGLSPLSFRQRWIGTFSDGDDRIDGHWETSADGRSWDLDFELTYRRVR